MGFVGVLFKFVWVGFWNFGVWWFDFGFCLCGLEFGDFGYFGVCGFGGLMVWEFWLAPCCLGVRQSFANFGFWWVFFVRDVSRGFCGWCLLLFLEYEIC